MPTSRTRPRSSSSSPARWREGYDVVYAVRDAREGETRFKRATAAAFYRGFNRISDVQVPLDAGDFRLVDRRALDVFSHMRESNRFVRGMFSWIGFSQTGVVVHAPGALRRARRSTRCARCCASPARA